MTVKVNLKYETLINLNQQLIFWVFAKENISFLRGFY